MSERWRPVVGCSYYEVSDLGNVRRVVGGKGTRAGKVLIRSVAGTGYYYVALSVGGIVKRRTVHSLVAEAFIGPRLPGFEVNHIDGSKINPVVTNLEYISHKANGIHAANLGLCQFGERNHRAKLTREHVVSIRGALAAGSTPTHLGRVYGVDEATIRKIRDGQRWKR